MATSSETRIQGKDCTLAQIGHAPLDQVLALISGRPEQANKRIRERLWSNIEYLAGLLEEQAEKIKEHSEERDPREHGFLIAQYAATTRLAVEMYQSLGLAKEIALAAVRRLTGDNDPSELRSANRRRLKPPIIREAEIS